MEMKKSEDKRRKKQKEKQYSYLYSNVLFFRYASKNPELNNKLGHDLPMLSLPTPFHIKNDVFFHGVTV
jgi:hypothetical protein